MKTIAEVIFCLLSPENEKEEMYVKGCILNQVQISDNFKLKKLTEKDALGLIAIIVDELRIEFKSLIENEKVPDERVREEVTGADTADKTTQDNDSFHSFESDNNVPELEKLDDEPNESMKSTGQETPIKPNKYHLDGKARKKLLIDWSAAREDSQKEQHDPQPKSPALEKLKKKREKASEEEVEASTSQNLFNSDAKDEEMDATNLESSEDENRKSPALEETFIVKQNLPKPIEKTSTESDLEKHNEQYHSQEKDEESVPRKTFDTKEKTVESEAPDENSTANPVEKEKEEKSVEKETLETQPTATSADEFSEHSSSEDEGELTIDEKKQEIENRELAEKIFNTDTEDESLMYENDDDLDSSDGSTQNRTINVRYSDLGEYVKPFQIVLNKLTKVELDKWIKSDSQPSSFALSNSEKSDESVDSDDSMPQVPRVLRQRNQATPNNRKRMVPKSLRSVSPEIPKRRGRPRKH